MTTPRRRLVRPTQPSPVTESPAAARQRLRLRTRLERERRALARYLARLRRVFHAFEKAHQCVARLERSLARLEE
jgi:hypothetical protein